MVLSVTISSLLGQSQPAQAAGSPGPAVAWGNNFWGQLGNNSTMDSQNPVAVSGLSAVNGIAGGWWHSLALNSDGTVWAWGYNREGELGNDSTTNSSIPVQVI